MTYMTAMNDAGLLREYAAQTFGHYLIAGGSPETARRFDGVVRRLAALTGLERRRIVRNLRADAEFFMP